MSKDNTIYVVIPKDGTPVAAESARLVEASSKAAVVHHVAAGFYDIRPASQRELVDAMKAGVNVEEAKKLGPNGNASDGAGQGGEQTQS